MCDASLLKRVARLVRRQRMLPSVSRDQPRVAPMHVEHMCIERMSDASLLTRVARLPGRLCMTLYTFVLPYDHAD